MSTRELLGRLNVDQLKDLMRATKKKSQRQNVRGFFPFFCTSLLIWYHQKSALIDALLSGASSQTILNFTLTKIKKEPALRQQELPFKHIASGQQTQEARLRELALNKLGMASPVVMGQMN